MGTGLRSNLSIAITRALAILAIFAQMLLLFAPLVELHDGDNGARAVLAGASAAPSIAAGQQSHTPQHNPTTCPACIAQSLHAQLESGVRLPTITMAQRAPVDLRAAALPHHDPPSTHHSRAPPVVS